MWSLTDICVIFYLSDASWCGIEVTIIEGLRIPCCFRTVLIANLK